MVCRMDRVSVLFLVNKVHFGLFWSRKIIATIVMIDTMVDPGTLALVVARINFPFPLCLLVCVEIDR